MGKRIANIQKKATNLSTEELVGTQAQRLGNTLPDPNSNKIGATASTNVQTPTDVPLQKKSAEDMQKIDQANRRTYVLDGDYETAMKKGDISPAEYVQAMKHKAQTEGRELDAYETALKIMKGDDTLTPEQQAKKERRERLGQVLSNVGNLIGNVANVYYASKGGLPINLNTAQMANNERYLQAIERRKALEQKGKETLLNAKQQDIKAAREAAIEARKQAQDLAKFNAQIEFDRDKHNSELEYKNGKDAADAAKSKAEQEYKNKQLEEQIRSNKANEAIRWKDKNEIRGSLGASDGYSYTRNRDLTDLEAQELVRGALRDDYIKQFEKKKTNEYGTATSTGEIDWKEALSYAASQGLISPEELTSRGFKKSKNKARSYNDGGSTKGDDVIQYQPSNIIEYNPNK